MKKSAITLRGVTSLLLLITLSLSIYLVFFSEGDRFWLILLSVSSALVLINSNVLFYSMQPVHPLREGSYLDLQNDWYPVLGSLYLGILFFGFLFVFLPQILYARNSYRPAQLFIICGTVTAIVFALITLINIKSPLHQKKIIGPVRMWQLALLLYICTGVFSWFLADWNPVLRHRYFKVRIIESPGFPPTYNGKVSDLDVGWLHKGDGNYKCRARMFLGNKRIYGYLGEGAFNCHINENKDGSHEIVGADNSLNDGDPAFIINTHRKYVLFKRYSFNKKVIFLKGEIL